MAERKKIRLSLQEVQPGMAVAEPICLEGEKIAFLAEGALLTERILELLRLRGQDALVVYVPAANDANFAACRRRYLWRPRCDRLEKRAAERR